MMGFVQTLLESETVTENRDRSRRTPTVRRLWVSEIGACPRRAILRINGYQGTPFPDRVRQVMALGKAYEDVTLSEIRRKCPGFVTDQISLRTPLWSGKVDFMVDLRDGTPPIIIEHKATGDKWWNYNGNLPHKKDVLQAVMYGQLWEEIHGLPKPRVVLYYRSWSNWAEFELTDKGSYIDVVGSIDGSTCNYQLGENLSDIRSSLEQHLIHSTMPKTPLSPSEELGCLFRGEPSCTMWEHCWGEGKVTWTKSCL